ncbi:MAG: CvpA family protein [Erysipelotrichales bacterium]
MGIDAIVIISFIALIIFGFFRGFMKSFLNVIFLLAYLIVSKYVLDNKILERLDFRFIKDPNERYIVLVIVGIILFIIFTLIIRKILKVSALKFIDRLGGVLIHVLVGYLALCIASMGYLSITKVVDKPEVFKDSFFFSNEFKVYNVLDR